MPGGEQVELFTLTNSNGVEALITNYGGIVVSLRTPDRHGIFDDVVLGCDSLAQYLSGHPYFGCIVGRYGNRIAKGRFSLDGEEFRLATNNGPNHLHGGTVGFDKVLWQVPEYGVQDKLRGGGAYLLLAYRSPDGEEGFPGNLDVKVRYELTNNGELRIDYEARTDKKTIVNLTHHSYFNLTGGCKANILGHELLINADAFIPVDETLIPTGGIQPLDDSPLDFRSAKPIGRDIAVQHRQMLSGQGYDHCWVLRNEPVQDGLHLAASVREPLSGRTMEVWTNEPGLQFYSGNFLDGSFTGKGGVVYQYRSGFCLETQHFPDSPNHANFPSVVLEPGAVYKTATVYQFGVK